MSKFIPLIESSQELRGFHYDDDEDKNLYLEGVVLTVDAPNLNQRIYPSKVFENALEKYSKTINDKRAFGELDHPSENVQKLNPEKLSHIFESIKKVGNQWIAKARILDTPSGNIVRGIVNAGGKIGMSLRSLGETVENGRYRMIKRLHLITLGDLVLDPSCDEFQNPVFENTKFVYENNQFRKVEKYKIPVSKLFEQSSYRPIVEREPLPDIKNWSEIYQEKML